PLSLRDALPISGIGRGVAAEEPRPRAVSEFLEGAVVVEPVVAVGGTPPALVPEGGLEREGRAEIGFLSAEAQARAHHRGEVVRGELEIVVGFVIADVEAPLRG